MVRSTALELGVQPTTLLNRLDDNTQLKLLLAEHQFYTTAAGTWLYHFDADIQNYINSKLRNISEGIAKMFDTAELKE